VGPRMLMTRWLLTRCWVRWTCSPAVGMYYRSLQSVILARTDAVGKPMAAGMDDDGGGDDEVDELTSSRLLRLQMSSDGVVWYRK